MAGAECRVTACSVAGSDGKFTLIISFRDWTMKNVDYAVMKFVGRLRTATY